MTAFCTFPCCSIHQFPLHQLPNRENDNASIMNDTRSAGYNVSVYSATVIVCDRHHAKQIKSKKTLEGLVTLPFKLINLFQNLRIISMYVIQLNSCWL